ncbi:MAG: tubulin-like doman-containing protein [candidate division WOR-3 bacterium]
MINKSNLKIARKVLCLMFGTGSQEVAVRAKRMIFEYLNSLEPFQMRIYDTHLKSSYYDELIPYFIQLNPQRAELIRTNPQEFPLIANHLRLESIPPITSTPGTGQFLSQGKLLFIASLKEIRDSIIKAVTPLLSSQLEAKLAQLNIQLIDDKIYVFLVRSLAGGVGSGSIDELTFLVRDELQKLLQNRSRFILIDILIRPEPFESHVQDKEKIWANAGVAITTKAEYNNFHRKYRAKYYENLIIEMGGKGADFNFLISNRNISGETDRTESGSTILTLEEVYELIAHFIFLHYTPMIGNFYEYFANIEHESHVEIRGQPAIFSSFGLLILKFPARLINEYLKHVFAIKILKHLLEGGEQCYQ